MLNRRKNAPLGIVIAQPFCGTCRPNVRRHGPSAIAPSRRSIRPACREHSTPHSRGLILSAESLPGLYRWQPHRKGTTMSDEFDRAAEALAALLLQNDTRRGVMMRREANGDMVVSLVETSDAVWSAAPYARVDHSTCKLARL
jgi:hypothetical protein